MLNIKSRRISAWMGSLFSLMLLGWLSPAAAVVGTLDTAPAATLLLPYFESNLANPNGAQTSLRLTNTSATSVLGHVTLWTDLGVPTLQFSMYFTGFDSVDLDLRLLFQGVVPQTASAGQDPTNTISPRGVLSQDINYASCSSVLPPPGLPPTSSGVLPVNTVWEPGTLAAIRAAHVGQPSVLWSGQCGGADHGDSIARGYITIDAVNSCTQSYPSDPGYNTVLTGQNILVGSYTRIDRSRNFAVTENLVAVESSFNDVQVNTSGRPTFYGRYNGTTAVDQREALGTVWQAPIVSGPLFSGGTQVVVWRDPGVAVSPFACGALPAPFPLTQRELVVFDEQEEPSFIASTTVFPLAAQSVDVATFTSNAYGFLRASLGDGSGTPLQSHVSVQHLRPGGFADGSPGQVLLTQSQIQCQLAGPGTCTQTFPAQFPISIQ